MAGAHLATGRPQQTVRGDELLLVYLCVEIANKAI